jgi:hypothetical protein
MAARAYAKISISIPADLAEALQHRVGARGVSGFAARAIRHELERAQLGELLAELDSELGPLPEALVREARTVWRKS